MIRKINVIMFTICTFLLLLSSCIITKVIKYKYESNFEKNLNVANYCSNLINKTELKVFEKELPPNRSFLFGFPADLAITLGLGYYIHPILGFYYSLLGYVHFFSERFPDFYGFYSFCGSPKNPTIPPFEYYYLRKYEQENNCYISEENKTQMIVEMIITLNLNGERIIQERQNYEYGFLQRSQEGCIYFIRIPKNETTRKILEFKYL